MQERIEEEKLTDLAQDERARIAAREKGLQDYSRLLDIQQREFDEYRRRTQEEQHKREAAFRKELEEREALFARREHKLLARQRDFEEQLSHRQAEAEMLRDKLQREVLEKEHRLQAAMVELAQEKERYNEESRKKIERTSKDYVADALQTLDNKEKEFHRISKAWGATGALALAGAIGYFVHLSLGTATTLPSPLTWEFIAFASFKGLFAIGLLAALAKYSFLFSRSYMQESLKNADRRHAINFGKFYLESYGAAADWSQVKEAFEHWNITASNAFAHTEPSGIDFVALEKAAGLFERAGKALPKSRVSSSGP
jgi:hypothetical protein